MNNRPHLRRRGAAVAASVLFALGALTACSDSGDGGDGGDKGDTTGQDSGDKGGDKGGDDGGDGGGDAAELTKDNVAEELASALKEEGSFAMNIAVTSNGQAQAPVKADVSYDDDEISSKMAMTGGVEAIVIGKIAYIKAPAFPDPAKYYKIDMAAPENKDNMWGAAAKQADPNTSFAVLGAASTFEKAGEEDFDGEKATKYRIVVPKAAYAEQLGTPELASMLPPEIEVFLWVDGDNRPLKQAIDMEIDVAGQKTKTATEVTFTDFGKDVDIDAPDAAQVIEGAPPMG